MEVDKEGLRERSDILDIVGSVVQLQRRGRNYVGLCPFHQEKTPSFNVDPVTQSFKCFGCGVWGDVFAFVQQHENMSFIEAAEYLARRAGVEFARPGRSQEDRGLAGAIYEANAAAATHFRRCLERADSAGRYLAHRGLTAETIERFQIGFAPDAWDALVGYLRSRKVDPAVAMAAGLLQTARGGNLIDVFRNRIIFPIHDDQMRIVGFGGRGVGDDPPKYLNTGETPVFKKSRLLYGLPFARRRIAEAGRTLLMEGYMDVIAAHQGGLENAVASLGTAFTPEHAKRIARLSPRVSIVYDADSAGIKAALKAAVELEHTGLAVQIVRLPPNEDPDSLLRSGQPDRLRLAIDHGITRVAMELDLAVEGQGPDREAHRGDVLAKVIQILATVPTRTERELYIERIWQIHPLSVQSPALAKEQLHRDAEDVAGRRPARSITPRRPYLRSFHPAPPPHTTDEQPPYPLDPSITDRRGSIPRRPARADVMLFLRALTSDALRSIALRLLATDDYDLELDRAIVAFAREEASQLGQTEEEFVHAIRRCLPEDLAEKAIGRLQDISTSVANEPIDEDVLIQAAGPIKERRAKQVQNELARLLQSKVELTDDDRDRVHELHELLRRLKGPTARP